MQDNTAETTAPSQAAELSTAFFGPTERISSAWDFLDCMECAKNGRWYEPPISFDGLARAFSSAVYHQSPLFFKCNVIMSCVEPHPLLTHDDMKGFVLDFLVFGNAYLEARRNRLGQVTRLIRTPAKYTRRGEQAGRYWFVKSWVEEHEFAPDSVFHLMNPDIHQEIYGLPEYLAGLVSASLSQVATLFRTRFFENGSHAGVLVHLTDALADPEGAKKLEQALSSARGNGAFRNVFVHTVGGSKDGIQIKPFSQIAAKDEFMNIKDATRDDMLAMHRVPPQLMGIIPNSSSNFGDVEKAAKVFAINELTPVMESLRSLNGWLGQEVIRFKPYALLDALGSSKI